MNTDKLTRKDINQVAFDMEIRLNPTLTDREAVYELGRQLVLKKLVNVVGDLNTLKEKLNLLILQDWKKSNS